MNKMRIFGHISIFFLAFGTTSCPSLDAKNHITHNSLNLRKIDIKYDRNYIKNQVKHKKVITNKNISNHYLKPIKNSMQMYKIKAHTCHLYKKAARG